MSICDIKRGTKLAKLLTETSLIIWDEALMTNKQCFEAFDRSLKDIMSEVTQEAVNIPFGGKVVVLGGDPKQILPVVQNGSKSQIINASIIKLYLWNNVKILFLTENMRLLSGATIRDTLIGVLRPLFKTQTPDKTTEPTKAHGLLLLQRKGKDSKKPSMRPIRIPLKPVGRPISASLEGSGSTLERVVNLRLARG